MSSNNTAPNWADLPLDLVPEIVDRLEFLVEFARFASVCRPWNQASKGLCKPKPSKLPWLMFSSPDDPDSRFFYSLTEKQMHKIHLPLISGHHVIGSSGGFLVSISDEALLYITSPLTGAHHALPSPVTLPDFPEIIEEFHDVTRDPSTGRITSYLHWEIGENSDRVLSDAIDYMCKFLFHKAVVTDGGGKPTVFVIYGPQLDIAFAMPGDTSWKRIKAHLGVYCDIIFRKGRLHAINFKGTVFIYDCIGNSREPSFTSPEGPLGNLNGNNMRYLVESPDGKDLYLIGRDMLDDGHPKPFNLTKGFMVFVLNERSYTWTPVDNVGDLAFFLGYNRSMALSVREFPELKENCIYFTDDLKLTYLEEPELAGDMGVYDLGDGSIQPLLPDTIDHQRLNWPPALWFTPVIS